MKTIIDCLIIILFSCLIISFIDRDFNPGNWRIFERVLMIFLSFVSILVYLFFSADGSRLYAVAELTTKVKLKNKI